MTGKYTIEIGTKEFLEGMTSSPETEDGGFSPQSSGLNIISNATRAGVLYAPADLTDKTGSLNGFIIASCEDSTTSSAKNKYLITSTGYVYYVDSSYNLTNVQNDAGRTYAYANTDIVSFKGAVYATSQTDIMLLSGGSALPTKDATWWTVTKSKSSLDSAQRHPMLVYEDILWIADGNALHKWDGTTATSSFLTLTSDQSIVALGVDPSTGLMMISVSLGQNASNTLPKGNKILLWDGFSTKVRRAIPIDSLATAFYQLGGTVFVCYGRNFGYWTGSGINFLRRFKRVTNTADLLVYKSKITNIGPVLYIADGFDIMAFGETLSGQKRFWLAYQVNTESQSYLRYAIFALGDNNLGIGYGASSTASFGVFDVTAVTAGGFNFYSRKYKFPRPIYIREIHIEYLDAVATTATTGTITFYDQNLTAIATPSLTNDSSSSTYEITRPLNNKNKIRTLQMLYTNSGYTSTVAGIRRFVISYDVAE
jgi:hypothetical protein